MEKIEKYREAIEETINSYETKVKSVTSLIRQSREKIKKYYNEQNILTNKLKKVLAKNQNLRKKDFDSMMEKVGNLQCFREKEISQILEDFCKEEEEMVAKLRQIIIGKSSSPLKDFKNLKEKILKRPMEREKEVSLMLKKFHSDHEEFTAALQKLLKKGDSIRIKDFKAMIKAFHIEHQEEATGIDEILEEFEIVKDDISRQWQKVMATLTAYGSTASLHEKAEFLNKEVRSDG